MRLKRGRLVGYEAGEKPGDLITKTFEWQGKALHVNANARSGEVLVEICNPSGNALSGFSRRAAIPIREDSLRAAVMFNGGKSLSTLRGRQVRLRMCLTRATVYGLGTA